MSLPDTLYHYCGSSAFASIIKTRSIRLSSLNLSNDSLEGRLVRSLVLELAADNSLNPDDLNRLDRALQICEEKLYGLGFCLSENGDLLSQWRGYADNAHGISIGFNPEYLQSLAKQNADSNLQFQICQVKYDKPEQLAIVHPAYDEICLALKNDAFPASPNDRTQQQDEARGHFVANMRVLIQNLFQLKSAAFREEQEWRLVSLAGLNPSEVHQFHSDRGKVTPYMELQLNEEPLWPVSEVILGPKHETPPSIIGAMLKQFGFGEVQVRKSQTSYR